LATGFFVGAAVGFGVGDGSGLADADAEGDCEGDGGGSVGSGDVSAGECVLLGAAAGSTDVRLASSAGEGLAEGWAAQPPGMLAEIAAAATSRTSTVPSSQRRRFFGMNRNRKRAAAELGPAPVGFGRTAATARRSHQIGPCRTGWAMRRAD
jgi:hypothetical protein